MLFYILKHHISRFNDGSGSDYEAPQSGDKRKRGEVEFSAAEFIKYNAKSHTGASDSSDDVCHTCGKCGELVLCDGCPHAFHLLCVGLTAVPEDNWFCGECVRKREDRRKERMSATEREGHTHDGDQNGADVEMGDFGVTSGSASSGSSGSSSDAGCKVEDGGRDGRDGGDGRISGTQVLSAIFMANKGDGRISVSDMTEINNAMSSNVMGGVTHNHHIEQSAADISTEQQQPQQSDDPQSAQSVESQQREQEMNPMDPDPVDDGFPEPDIDVVVEESSNLEAMEMDTEVTQVMEEQEPQQELPSPDAPDSGLDHDAEAQPQCEPLHTQLESSLPEPHQTEAEVPHHEESHQSHPEECRPEESLAEESRTEEPHHEEPAHPQPQDVMVPNPADPLNPPSEPQGHSVEDEPPRRDTFDAVISEDADTAMTAPIIPQNVSTNECQTEVSNHSEEQKEESQIGSVSLPQEVAPEPQCDTMAMMAQSANDSMEPKPTTMPSEPAQNVEQELSVSNGQGVVSEAKMCGPSDTGDDSSMVNEEENNTDTDNTENIQNIQVEANKNMEVDSLAVADGVAMEQQQHAGHGAMEDLQLNSKMQSFQKMASMDIEEKEAEQNDVDLSVSDPNDNLYSTGSQEF